MSDLVRTYEELEEEDFIDPETKQVHLEPELKGKRIAVYWDKGVGWEQGTIDAFDEESKQHHITFDDGLERSMNPKKPRKKWQLVGYQQKDAEELV